MAGNLDLKELEDLIRKEDVDTVLTVFPRPARHPLRGLIASFASASKALPWAEGASDDIRPICHEQGLIGEHHGPPMGAAAWRCVAPGCKIPYPQFPIQW